MPTAIQPIRLNHMNLVLQDFGESLRHFQGKYDAELLVDMPKPECHACLVETGCVLFELFFPSVYLLNARYGPHYVGVEYQANMEVVSRAVAEQDRKSVV